MLISHAKVQRLDAPKPKCLCMVMRLKKHILAWKCHPMDTSMSHVQLFKNAHPNYLLLNNDWIQLKSCCLQIGKVQIPQQNKFHLTIRKPEIIALSTTGHTTQPHYESNFSIRDRKPYRNKNILNVPKGPRPATHYGWRTQNLMWLFDNKVHSKCNKQKNISNQSLILTIHK